MRIRQAAAIKTAIEVGIHDQRGDRVYGDAVRSLTPHQVEWLAIWLASKGIGKLPKY